MRAAVDEDLLDASVGQELKSILDEWGVCKRQQALKTVSKLLVLGEWAQTRGCSSVNGLKRVSKGSARIYEVSQVPG